MAECGGGSVGGSSAGRRNAAPLRKIGGGDVVSPKHQRRLSGSAEANKILDEISLDIDDFKKHDFVDI